MDAARDAVVVCLLGDAQRQEATECYIRPAHRRRDGDHQNEWKLPFLETCSPWLCRVDLLHNQTQ